MRRLSAAVAVVFALTVLGTAPAAAEPPSRLSEQVADRAGVLGGDAGRVRQALEKLRTDAGTQLWVVYVASFDGADGQRWAADTARLSQLGTGDVLFAVAVQDRAYGYSAPGTFAMSDSDLADLMVRRVEPRLAANDWDGAAVAMADGLRSGTGGGSGRVLVWLLIAAAVVVAVVVALVVARRRRRAAGGRPAVSGPAPVPIEELSRRAASALIAADDAVETSEQELAFAQAQFGDDAVTAFRAALDQAGRELREAFALRQRLDDAQPEDEQTRRAMLTDIIRLSEAADRRLDEQAEAFDRLRQLERTAPDVLAELTPRLDALAAALPQEQERLAKLRGRFAEAALATVADNLTQAGPRLDAAKAELAEVRSALAAGRRGPAVVSLRAAEDAAGQAERLLASAARLEAQLDQSGTRAAAARAEILRDLEDARSLSRSGGGAELDAVMARAEAAVSSADAALDPPGDALPDPLAAMRQLDEAATALDHAIARAHEARRQREHTKVLLDRALFAANSAIASAGDFIATRRGGVGAEARTRLAEARRNLDEALAGASSDPESALRQAQYADTLAQQALQLAQADVDGWSSPAGLSGYGRGGGVDLGSLILGGILLGGRGGGAGGAGGGWSPGSFGGSGTRGRIGGGGRF